jgi:tripartite-type tricarboxylate transporter receptor subunit TctC
VHDAFRKALEEPKIAAVLDRFDQPMVHMSAEDCTKFARQTFEAERTTVERLGLKGALQASPHAAAERRSVHVLR